MTRTRLFLFSVVVLGFAAQSFAAAIVLDFEDLRNSGTNIYSIGPVYQASGMQLTATHASNSPNFALAGTQSSSFGGSTALYNHNSQGTTTLTASNGGLFDLLSLDLLELPAFQSDGVTPINYGAGLVRFTGVRMDGSFVQFDAPFAPFNAISTVMFTGFRGLRSVSWQQGAGGPTSLTHQFDNLVVDTTPVPEPSTLGLLTAGLLGAFTWRRRRRS